MKIAVTGAAGFIAQRLIPLLEQAGHEIVPIDIAGPNPCDLLNVQALREVLTGCSAIYHLAAEHKDNVTPITRYYDVNVQGTKNLLVAADTHGIKRVIFTSSFAVYGLDQGIADEQSPTKPFNHYGKSKLEAEDVLRAWQQQDPSRGLTLIRPVVVFGEGNRGNVHTLIDQIMRNRFLMVGRGKNAKSTAYVGNVAAFLAFCLPQPSGICVYNYADQPDLEMTALINLIYEKLNKRPPRLYLPYPLGLVGGYGFDILSRVTGRRFPISAVRVQKFCANTLCSAAAARQAGFTPPYTLQEGLNRMIEADFLQTRQTA